MASNKTPDARFRELFSKTPTALLSSAGLQPPFEMLANMMAMTSFVLASFLYDAILIMCGHFTRRLMPALGYYQPFRAWLLPATPHERVVYLLSTGMVAIYILSGKMISLLGAASVMPRQRCRLLGC